MTDLDGDTNLVLQDHILVETEWGGRSVSFRAVVVKTSPDEIWLGLTTPDHRLGTLDPGQNVRLTVARPGYALLGQSAFIRHLGESRSRIFAVVQTPRLERAQRRAHARIDVELNLRLRRLDPVTGEQRGKGASGVTLNASPGGLLFETDMEVTIGDDLDVTISLSGDDRISAAARVIRSRGREDRGPVTPGLSLVAVKFTRITAVDQQRIVRHCLMIEHRRQLAAQQASAVVQADSRTAADGPAAMVGAATIASLAPDPAAVAAAVAKALSARAAKAAAQAATASGSPAKPDLAPVEACLARVAPDAPLVEVGLSLCEVGEARDVRLWFDRLVPFDRISLLTHLQANMHGEAVPGAASPGLAQPLAHALGLI